MALTRIRAEQISDIDYKQAVRVITLANITLSGGAPAIVDNVSLSVDDRILVAGQSTGSQNGLYQVQTVGAGNNGTWIRTSDGNSTGEIEAGMIVMVTEGDVYKDTQWKLTTNNPIVIGSTALVFEQNSAYAFGNIYANGTAVLASSVGDALTLTPGDNIAITGNNTSKTVTIGVTGISLNSISNGTSNVNVTSSGGNVTVGIGGTNNIAVFSTAGIDVIGQLSATGNVIADNLISDNLISSGALAITTGTNGDINIQPNGTGNIVLSNTYINSVRYPVQDQDAASKIYVDNLVSTAISYHESVVASTTTDLGTTTGGTITYNQPNGAGNGIGATLTTTGSFNLIDGANVQTANTRILVKNEANAVHNGVYVWSNATVITRSTDTNTYGAGNVDALGINDYFYTTSGTVNKGTAFIVDAPSGVITFGTSNIQFAIFSQTQVYSANTDAGLSLIGTQFNAKVDNNTTAFDGSGNIIVKAGANLTTPNIGAATGTSLSVTGNTTSGNVNTDGLITATGNVTGGNVLTAGAVSATGNVIGGNLVTGGLATVTGNITGGNVLTGGLMSATGNVTGGNVVTTGVVSATGNVSGNYFLGNGSQLTGISATSTEIINGTSNVSINSANANVTITVAGATDSSIFSPGSLFTGIIAVPKTLTGNVVMAANCFGTIFNGTVITGNLYIPDGTTVYPWTPS